MLESLERRLLLSSVVYQNQILTITGSPGRDRIRVNILMDTAGSGAFVVINGHRRAVRNFPYLSGPAPRGVVVESGRGDDTITLSNLEGIPATIRAGSGNDVIK